MPVRMVGGIVVKGDKVGAEIAGEVAPDGVNVVCIVQRVVILLEESCIFWMRSVGVKRRFARNIDRS